MPTAMTTLGRLGKDHMFLWAWGVNGCFSVIGAALVPIVATSFGLPAVVLLGAAAYLIALPAFFSVLKPLPPPHVTGNTRPIKWLGMELITAPQGVPMVETVQPNSNGDRAGIEPGDTILLIDKRPVGSTGSITDALKGLHSGDRVALTVSTGGAILQLFATLAAPPSAYP